MKFSFFLFASFLFLTANPAQSQAQLPDPSYRRFFTGSTFFMLENGVPDILNPSGGAWLDAGYRVIPKMAQLFPTLSVPVCRC